MLDAVCVGTEQSRFLHALAKATNGYVFRPRTVSLALQLAECEPFLSLRERPPRAAAAPGRLGADSLLLPFADPRLYPEDRCDGAAVPERVQDPGLRGRVGTLQSALDRAAAAEDQRPVSSSEGASSAATRRVMQEMRSLQREPHCKVDLFPCEEDCFFWRAVMEAPDGSLYRGGAFLLYVRFPGSYPAQPPVVRFVTPIRHCNINSYGKVCHSVLDRNWSPDTPVRMVLDCVYGLLLSPDYDDPLDSALALLFFQGSGAYGEPPGVNPIDIYIYIYIYIRTYIYIYIYRWTRPSLVVTFTHPGPRRCRRHRAGYRTGLACRCGR